jgi:hypothetical protein
MRLRIITTLVLVCLSLVPLGSASAEGDLSPYCVTLARHIRDGNVQIWDDFTIHVPNSADISVGRDVNRPTGLDKRKQTETVARGQLVTVTECGDLETLVERAEALGLLSESVVFSPNTITLKISLILLSVPALLLAYIVMCRSRRYAY